MFIEHQFLCSIDINDPIVAQYVVRSSRQGYLFLGFVGIEQHVDITVSGDVKQAITHQAWLGWEESEMLTHSLCVAPNGMLDIASAVL